MSALVQFACNWISINPRADDGRRTDEPVRPKTANCRPPTDAAANTHTHTHFHFVSVIIWTQTRQRTRLLVHASCCHRIDANGHRDLILCVRLSVRAPACVCVCVVCCRRRTRRGPSRDDAHDMIIFTVMKSVFTPHQSERTV